MEKLEQELDILIKKLENEKDFRSSLEKIRSAFPFNKYEYIISALLAHKKLNFDEYIEMRDSYINRNIFLYVFEISAPRGFGDTWAFGHLTELEPELKRPSKHVDASYAGEYDFYLPWNDDSNKNHFIKIEVKASRANDRERNEEPLYIKALSSTSKRPFLMNFQQLKPKCCDVFLWIAVYRDKIKYWIINSNIIQTNQYFTPQHRNEATAGRKRNYAKDSIYEGQIMIVSDNISSFDKFIATSKNLKEAIIEQYKNKLAESGDTYEFRGRPQERR